MTRVLPRPAEIITAPITTGARLAGRALHPWAWWGWAIGAGVAVSMSTNPLLLILLIAAVVFVVLRRRTDAPWARSLVMYFVLAGFVVAVRLIAQIVIGGFREGTVLFSLPDIALPAWAAGIRLGGPVTLEGLVYTLVDAGRLAALLICIGAANALANPKRALRNVPAAFHQVATALVISISVAPQLIESVFRVRKARRLRGGIGRGLRGVVSVIVPVMEDAIDRSIALAAGMESRGYGRTRTGRRLDWPLAALLVTSMLLVTFSAFALLGISQARGWAAPLLLIGLAGGAFGLHRAGEDLAVTRYRPDPWGGPEFAVLGTGLAAATLVIWLSRTDSAMAFASYPLVWPELTWPMLVAVALVGLPGLIAPRAPKGAG